MNTDDYRRLLSGIYGGRRWILARDVLAGLASEVDTLKAFGAERCLCIAAATGTGEPPDPDFAPDPIVFDVKGDTIMGGIRASMAALNDLPPEALAQIEAFDPKGEARAIGSLFDAGDPIGGRAKFGARARACQRLEDKTTIDALWDRLGVRRAPREIVRAERSALTSASAKLDQGLGAVWVGDNKEGWHGGGEFLRWVRTEAHTDEAVAFMEAHCDRVRVMPFIEGIPCSIHAMVFPEEVIVFRPCEMLVFRRPGQARLHYGRAATFWDPPPADRDEMRSIARRVGEHLRTTLGYRGALTVDGIMGRDGFVPTELNPRWGAALGVISRGLPDLPMRLIDVAVVEGVEVDWQPRALERLVLGTADRHRAGSGLATVHKTITETHRRDLVFEGDAWRFATQGEPRDADFLLGPGAVGGYLTVNLDGERTPRGPSVAPRVVSALAFIDEAYSLDIGPLEPARDLRADGRTP